MTVEFMNLETHACESSVIDSSCWCTFLSPPLILDHASVVYPGIPHPRYGLQSSLCSLLANISFTGMSSLHDVDLTQFSTASDWYNYDGSANSTWFGTLFDAEAPLYQYQGRTRGKPDLQTGTVSHTLLRAMLTRFVGEFGFTGLWWRGLLCLRLDSRECEQGEGSDNKKAVRFLRSMSNSIPFLFGEDTRGVVNVKNPDSVVRDITASASQHGLGFRGALDESM